MTAAGNMALAKRADRSFRFLKNGVVADEFHPASARLHFASKSTDTLTLGGLPPGLLAAGNTVTVQYRADAESAWATVFSGDVARITDTCGRGDERQHTVVCEGPWGKMSRLVFRQTWAPNVTGASFSSARVILNQSPVGEPYTITQQVQEIANFAAAKCGFSAGTASLGNTVLPKDETRDITCAAAIQRELRFFPKKVVRFDYSGPTLVMSEPSTSGNAGYVADVPKTAREYVYNAHPISAVDVYTDDVQIVTGNNNVDKKIAALSHQVYPSGADTSGLDVLHCYVPLARASSHSSWKSLESDTEEITSYNLNSNVWWRNKHPRLKDIPLANITISDGDYEPKTYTRIARNTADELAEAGLHSKVAVFTCKCKIATDDDEEEDILLTMEFLTTDAMTRTYTWQTGSSSVAGETLPTGLAEALYRQRAGSLVQERMTIRLLDDWPVIGDAADGLVLQEIDVDCGDCTAALSFGQPEALSAEDMRSLLNGFRQRGYAENAPIRANGEADASDATPVGGIKPLSSSEWSPGTKVKTKIQKVGAANRSASTKSIFLDSTAIPQDCESGEIAVHEFSYLDKDGDTQVFHGLFCDDIDLSDLGKIIKSAKMDPVGGEMAIVLTYTDGTSDTFVLSGLQGPPGSDGQDGETPEITAEKSAEDVRIYADGELIATIPIPKAPEITADKSGKTTTIYADGDPIATIEDGADGQDGQDGGGSISGTDVTVITGISFSVYNGKLVARLQKSKIKSITQPTSAGTSDVNVCDVEEVTVVTSETYNTGTHQFTNERAKVKVLGTASASGQTPFTATPLSGEQ